MDKFVKDIWVKALRSGEYVQGEGKLHYTSIEGNDKFCCLGVLCDIAYQQGIVERDYSQGDEPDEDKVHSYDSQECFTPTSVVEWAGLEKADPSVGSLAEYGGRVISLVDLNDEFHYSFDKIADRIEEYL